MLQVAHQNTLIHFLHPHFARNIKKDWNDYIWWMLPWKLTIHCAPADASNVPPAHQRDWIKCINNMHQLLLLWCVNSSYLKRFRHKCFQIHTRYWICAYSQSRKDWIFKWLHLYSIPSFILSIQAMWVFGESWKCPWDLPQQHERVFVTINQFMPLLFHLPAEHCSLCYIVIFVAHEYFPPIKLI